MLLFYFHKFNQVTEQRSRKDSFWYQYPTNTSLVPERITILNNWLDPVRHYLIMTRCKQSPCPINLSATRIHPSSPAPIPLRIGGKSSNKSE